MNRHEDDESTGHSSQSSRHSSRLFKYDDITILIEALTGQLYELKCSPTENILSIKGRLARLEGISANQQHIIYSGKLLDDSSVLKDVGVQNFSKLRLVTQMRGGPVNTRVIDDEPEESDAEIALVVVKDGERVSLVRFPFTGSIYQAEYESDQFRHFMARHPIHPSHTARPISREKFKARQAYEDNKKTESKMEEIRRKMKAKKSINKLPDIKPRSSNSMLPPISQKYGIDGKKPMLTNHEPVLKLPVPNNHSNFLQKYGLRQSRASPLTVIGGDGGGLGGTRATPLVPGPTLVPGPPIVPEGLLPPVKKTRPRCAKCGKRLGLTEQYRCRCGDQYCTRHRYAEEHDCSYDYQSENKAKLRNQNHSLQPPKLPKI